MQNKTVKEYILSILTVIYDLMPLMANYIYTGGVNALSPVFLRNLPALPTLGVLTFIKHCNLKISLNDHTGLMRKKSAQTHRNKEGITKTRDFSRENIEIIPAQINGFLRSGVLLS